MLTPGGEVRLSRAERRRMRRTYIKLVRQDRRTRFLTPEQARREYPEAVQLALDAFAGTVDSVDHAVIHTVKDGIRIVPFS